MKIGVVGLGRMGANIARRLTNGRHQCVVFDVDAAKATELASKTIMPAPSLGRLLQQLPSPRIVWVMLPAGDATEQTVLALAGEMAAGDIVIDGGNTFYQDDIRRAGTLARSGIHYVDVGTSGGVWGLERGYCLMIGGEPAVVAQLEAIFSTLAPGSDGLPRTPGRSGAVATAELGYLHCGRAGAGHFVKMIHNGIEYGLMQAYAEGFDILHSVGRNSVAPERRYELDLGAIAELWRHGSVVSSWLLDLTASALAENETLSGFSGVVQDSGEGRWTVNAAVEMAVPAEVLSAALFARFRSRQDHTFAEKVLSAMRLKFGGHVEPKSAT
ncbi:MAG: phosphogluconate dehydrogenase (NAD(+)-dependent, decarboxylating) [Xanthobacteraceae bacterium]